MGHKRNRGARGQRGIEGILFSGLLRKSRKKWEIFFWVVLV